MDWQALWDWEEEVAKVIERNANDVPLLPWQVVDEKDMSTDELGGHLSTDVVALVDGEEVARLVGFNVDDDDDDSARWQLTDPEGFSQVVKDWKVAAEFLAERIVREAS